MVRPLHMNTSLPPTGHRTDPEIGSGEASGETPARRITGLYRALQAGAEVFGGAVTLAAAMRKRVPDVSQRLRRAQDSNGDVQRASLDMMGHVATDPEARWAMLAVLCEEWGAEPPQRKRTLTREQIAEAALRVIGKSGVMADGHRKAIARELGVGVDEVIW